MNGAESLLAAMTRNGIDVCFANPGTSELHFVGALDRAGGMRCVLGLFEGVLTGAADGYARMADRPASTLLHLGPGLANGLSNLHNAMRAQSPIVNIIGDHATYHRHYDAPLTSDIEGTARPFSHWVRTSPNADSLRRGRRRRRRGRAYPPGPGRVADPAGRRLLDPADHRVLPRRGGRARSPAGLRGGDRRGRAHPAVRRDDRADPRAESYPGAAPRAGRADRRRHRGAPVRADPHRPHHPRRGARPGTAGPLPDRPGGRGL